MYTIGKLARRAKVKANTVRFYEGLGLIAAGDITSAGYRLYDEAALSRLLLIKCLQRCGFSLADISRLLALGTASPIADAATCRMLARKKAELEETIVRPGVAPIGASNDNGAKLWQIRYVYTFSKRTEFNFGYSHLDNDSVGTYNLGGLSPSPRPGEGQHAWVTALRHRW